MFTTSTLELMKNAKSIALLILSMKNKVQRDGKMMAFISGLWFTEGQSLFRMAKI